MQRTGDRRRRSTTLQLSQRRRQCSDSLAIKTLSQCSAVARLCCCSQAGIQITAHAESIDTVTSSLSLCQLLGEIWADELKHNSVRQIAVVEPLERRAICDLWRCVSPLCGIDLQPGRGRNIGVGKHIDLDTGLTGPGVKLRQRILESPAAAPQ